MKKIDLDKLMFLCSKNGFQLKNTQLEALAVYLELLLKWNKAMNLVGPSNWQTICETLIFDSFYLYRLLPELPLAENPVCWDFGAGAGLPGIPLRLLWNDGEYTMVEARKKRALFLQTAIANCKLQNTFAFRGRAEDFMHGAKPANLLLSRAFMPWRDILELVQGKLAAQALLICLTLKPAPAKLPDGWTLITDHTYSLAGDTSNNQPRHFWVLSPVTFLPSKAN